MVLVENHPNTHFTFRILSLVVNNDITFLFLNLQEFLRDIIAKLTVYLGRRLIKYFLSYRSFEVQVGILGVFC